MAKIRIYELARELGLENKAILDLCVQLGFEEKASHSNTLSDEEAEKIRRSVIRRAVSGKGNAEREVEKEGQTLTEKRVGNVIRRRKKEADGTPLEDEADDGSPRIDFSDVPQKNLELQRFVPDLQQERDKRNEALAQANALFATKPATQVAPEVGNESSTPSKSLPDNDSDELDLSGTQVAARETSAENVRQERAQEGEIENAGERLDEARKRHDIRAPKVLGRIELAAQAKVQVQEARSSGGAIRKSKEVPVVEDETDKLSSGKSGKGGKRRGQIVEFPGEGLDGSKRHRKKQILKKDELIDYEGERDNWRQRREKKQKKGKEAKGLEGEGEVSEFSGTKPAKKQQILKIDKEISVGEFAKSIGVKIGDVMKVLMNLGIMANINQLLDFDTTSLVAEQFGVTVTNVGLDEDEFIKNLRVGDTDEVRVLRPPVVTVMGHVDHGKTSLLDAIRETSVTAQEAGGITQHIGAYNVPTKSGGSVTFLDTPGHEAFTAMRGRGASITDIVVLVVAADDGFMPQTVEAINHAKAASVPIILAVNKIDKEGANPERIKSQMVEHGLVPEDWGGDTIVCPVSAKTREGIDTLLENLHAQAEILELKANPERACLGTVVESRLDKNRGTLITVLVQNGTLKKGDIFISGSINGRVRALFNSSGHAVESAGPSIPVEVMGATGSPHAGDDFFVLSSEAEAKRIAEMRAQRERTRELTRKIRGAAAARGGLTLETFSELVKAGEVKELPLIVKADVQGSVEAVSDALQQISNSEVEVRVIHKGVGAVTENDVQLAVASKAIIVAFNVRADTRTMNLAESEGVSVLYSRVIYELTDLVTSAMKGLLAPQYEEKTLGHAEVRETFKVPKFGLIAGSYVLDGTILRGARVRLLRDNKVIHEGKMGSLRRFKDDVKEVQAGYECGISIDGFQDIQKGDVFEIYKVEEIPR